MLELSSDLFGRGKNLRVFVSSKMSGGALTCERRAAVTAIHASGAESWCWENDAPVGPYHAEEICVGFARESDSLVLIIDDELTPITQREYEAARDAGAQCFIFVKHNPAACMNSHIKSFISQERKHAITLQFQSTSELQTRITQALHDNHVIAVRERISRARAARAPQPLTLPPALRIGYTTPLSNNMDKD